MNNRILSCLCVMISIVVFLTGCVGEKAPRIKFSERVFLFDEINEGEIVEHTFTFMNAGTEPLLITEVKATCGCTVPGDYTKEVEPGKTGEIPVRFNSRGFHGHVVKTMKVSTNIPDSEPVHISLEGTIRVLLEVSTRTIRLGQTKEDGPPLSGSVILTNHTDTPLEIYSVETNDPRAVTNMTVIEEGQVYSIEVTVAPPFLMSHVRKPITIKTNIEGKENFSIDYYYYGVTDIEVAPKDIIIYLKHLQPDLTRIITVQSHTDASLEIINLRTNSEKLNVSQEILVPGKHMQIILYFQEGFTFPENKAVLVFFTLKTEKGETEYTIPIINGDTLSK